MARTDLPCFALRTFRADGSGVVTPVWLAPHGDALVGFTPARSGKARRIAADPRVEVAPATFDGEPLAPFRPGTARIVTGPALAPVRAALRARYGRGFRVLRLVTLLGRARRRGGPGVGVVVREVAT
ncbi:PPOX class F420-dependent oxidoreductase [Pseudonocardia humida]|uniref:PPOX class F420-dependent oxidoreductase n=1 Tax=Pseudonocardia humida TaxID=2800819 RepID=A0ABT1AAI0_9PSEU|nr:PPOX class F420-dependent oxidoreductase [Pseudonocardia humida]MCO1659943.1 PPOX class F420-dependent oxidoreductase [Pseudonocardia humida]